MAGTLKNISEVLADLADNNTKDISPLDVRQIVTSNYQPQMILSITTFGVKVVQSGYRCLYYNPLFFEPAGETATEIADSNQIWQFTTNTGSSLGNNTTVTGVEVRSKETNPVYGLPVSKPMIITVTTGGSGQIIKYNITSPGQGWAGKSLQGQSDSYDGEEGELYSPSGNATGIIVKFNGPIRIIGESKNNFNYTLTTNPNDSDFSIHSPGQGSVAVAQHNNLNTVTSCTMIQPFVEPDQILVPASAAIFGEVGGTVGDASQKGPNILNVTVPFQGSSRTIPPINDGGTCQISFFRTPGSK